MFWAGVWRKFCSAGYKNKSMTGVLRFFKGVWCRFFKIKAPRPHVFFEAVLCILVPLSPRQLLSSSFLNLQVSEFRRNPPPHDLNFNLVPSSSGLK